MKTNLSDLSLTAIAPIVWGSTYLVTTQFLPGFSPMTVAMLRALPAGLLLLVIMRQLPAGIWWLRAFVLGALNISIFLTMLFVAAYRLPGGVAGTVLSAQPLIVVFLAAVLLSGRLRPLTVLAALIGMGGVALLVLTPNASLDAIGIAAGLAGATSMALGSILARKWQPPVSPLTFTAWQLTSGGLLLLPVVLFVDRAIPVPTVSNLLGLVWLGLIGAAVTYALWFRGIGRLAPSVVSSLLFLSPLTAVLLGWVFLGQTLSILQITGIALVVGSIWLSQRAND
ncbi:EamA family transporter [Paracoccus onubensis]|uniref:EamA family transporter n=1 Tax=Paracoccus onubensis TaxID=1675788 RepID=A0A418T7D6_9RHOB|nr:EamA family transporter [Paracoccus onubensis]RJE89145.1 EamA family transporter [Paracoccus onubensis]